MTQTAVFLTAVRRRIRPSRTLPFLVVGLLLALLLLFFVLPVIWLLLAPSKTAGEVVRDNPSPSVRSIRSARPGGTCSPSRTAP